MKLVSEPLAPAPETGSGDVTAEMQFAVFALEAGLMEIMPSTTDGVYPFTMKTTYSSGSDATDD